MSRPARILLLTALILGAVVAGVWIALPRIAETIISDRLDALGLPGTVTVERVDLAGARLTGLEAGDGTLSASGIDVAWSASAGAVTEVVVEDLRVTGRWTDSGLDLGPLDALLAGDGSDDGDAAPDLPVDRVVLRDARVEIALPKGALTAVLNGAATRAAAGPALDLSAAVTAPGLDGTLAFTGTASGGEATPVSGTGRLGLTAEGFAAPGVAGAIDGALAADLAVGADTLRLDADAPVTLVLRDLAPVLADALAGVTPPPDAAAAARNMTLRLAAPEAAGPSLVVTGIGDASGLMIASDGLRLAATYGATEATATAAGSLRFGSGLPAAVLKDLSLAADGLMVAGVPLSGRLENAAATLSARGATAEGDVTLDVGASTIDTVALGSAALDARLRLTLTADGTGALYADRATLRAEGLVAGNNMHVTEPVTLTLAETEVPLLRLTRPEAPDAPPGLIALVQAAFADPDLALTVPVDGGARPLRLGFERLALEARARLGAGALETASLTASGGRVTSEDVTFTGVSLNAGLTEAGPTLDLSGAIHTLPGETEALAGRSPIRPYTVRLQARPAEPEAGWQALQVDLSVRDAARAPLVNAQGRVDLSGPSARLRVDVPRQVFDPQGLKPGDLHGQLGTFAHGVTGSLAVEGTVSYANGVLDPDLRVLLRDLTLSQGFVTLQRINGVLELDSLAPLATRPGQEVSVAVIEAGLPVTDAVANFQVSEGQLHLDRASATLAGGQLTADPTSIPLDLSTGRMTLRVRDLGLTPLIDLLQVEGLNAQGTLAGEVPLRFAGGDVIINDAVLRSQEPDRVAYKPDTLPPALSGGGESVDMVMEALQDFHYNSLRLTVDGRASGQLEVTLHIAGANPAFYDGYPVEFNLSVSGELAEAVQAGLQGYRVPDRIRDRIQQFQE